MSEASHPHRVTQLRRDLRSVKVDARPRPYRIVIDELSGSFNRVAEHVWQSLVHGDPEPSLWREAGAAGWTRERADVRSKPFSPLYFRVPFGSIDRLASGLAPLSGVLFSVQAFVVWIILITIAGLLVASRSGELIATLGSLPLFLAESNPVWLAILFVATKVVHELAHAVTCRRMGSRCGDIGLLFLVGVPCPYCDVTDIWRQPSAMRRASVMLAGIYVELVLAAIAALVWVSATDPVWRMHALNLMVVCGASTLLFNANPLMRYDGYYVMGDLLGSSDLRREARDAFSAVVTARLAGACYRLSPRRDKRSLLLTLYHSASTVYRLLVVIAIATMFLGVAEYFQVRDIASGIVTMMLAAIVLRWARSARSVVQGRDRWEEVPPWRRCGIVAFMAIIIGSGLFVPLPRYRSAGGWVDVADATNVYLPSAGMIKHVAYDYGQVVQSGESLVSLDSESLLIQQAELRGQLRVARLRSRLSRRVSLDRTETAEQWDTLQAAEDSFAAQLASVEKRVQQAGDIVAPVGGVILPSDAFIRRPPHQNVSTMSDATRAFNASAAARGLVALVGTAAEAHETWCRISPNGELHAIVVIDARDRAHIDIGTPVRIGLLESPNAVVQSTVTSVSPIEKTSPSVIEQAAYQVLCPLPDVDRQEILRWLGKECSGVFELPRRNAASNVAQWASEWLGGE